MTIAITICICIFFLRNFVESGLSNKEYVDHIHECVNYRQNEQLLVDPTLDQLRNKLSKFIKGKMQPEKREASTNNAVGKRKSNEQSQTKKAEKKSKTDQEWNDWTPWSSCSVSCGKGRRIRWRHCRKNCQVVETEMEQKLCQLPACPQKLFGLINL